MTTQMSNFLKAVWNEFLWIISPNKFGPDISQEEDFLNLLYPLPVTVGLLAIRYALHWYCFTPLADYLGIKTPKHPILEPNHVLEEYYKQGAPHSKITGVAKQLDMQEREVEIWMRKRAKQDRPSILTKFSESCWKFCYYSFIFTFGMVVLWGKPWLWDINQCWGNWPEQVLSTDVWFHAIISMSFYWSLLLGQILMDVKRKDFWQMFTHHILTIFLISLSFMVRGYRIGSLVMVVHDLSDVFLEGAKAAKYARKETISTCFFILLLFSWIITRIVIFPIWIIRFTLFTTPNHVDTQYIFNGMLVSLLCLHCYWLYLLLKIAYRAVRSGELGDDVRSSSEETD